MDIEYLLSLQGFRDSIEGGLNPFMEMISLFAVTYLIIVPVMVYWCLDKRAGLYTLGSFTTAVAVNAVVKLTVCAPRPWIRDGRVLPAGNAIETATGYSFPSGHTVTAAPVYGGLAVSAWKKMKWVSVLCVICILLTGFSRNYLGVHTPQDVAVAMAESALVLWGMAVLFKYLDRHPEKEIRFLLSGLVLCAGMLVFITLKQYPVFARVDPEKMKKDGYGDIGKLAAFCLGRLIERRWIRFEPRLTKRGLAAALAGAVLLFFLIEIASTPLTLAFGSHGGAFAYNLVIYLFIMAGWPAVMKAAARRE